MIFFVGSGNSVSAAVPQFIPTDKETTWDLMHQHHHATSPRMHQHQHPSVARALHRAARLAAALHRFFVAQSNVPLPIVSTV